MEMSKEPLVEYQIGRPLAHGPSRVGAGAQTPPPRLSGRKISTRECVGDAAAAHSAERRNSRGGSDRTAAGLGSDLTGSRLPDSTRGVSALADTSTDPVWSSTRSERG